MAEISISIKKEKDKIIKDKIIKDKIKKDKIIKKKDPVIFSVPAFNEYSLIRSAKYTLPQVKLICKHYNQKTTGNKEQLLDIIYTFLYKSNYAQKIQRVWKKYCVKVTNTLRGPANKNRALCVNETEFFTMDPISSIDYLQFFSFKDTDDMIYGFDILSLYNLITKSGKIAINPYNRNLIKPNVKQTIYKLIKYSKFIKQDLNVVIEDVEQSLDMKSIRELRIKTLFQEIDNLGNYTNHEWFSSLDRPMLLKFIRELHDIWEYRAHLSQFIKNEICPPLGNPFLGLNMMELPILSFEALQCIALRFMENMVQSGINRESKCLGCNYILCAITLVHPAAAQALPWLFYSVAQID